MALRSSSRAGTTRDELTTSTSPGPESSGRSATCGVFRPSAQGDQQAGRVAWLGWDLGYGFFREVVLGDVH